MTIPPLYILRHGETEWNAAGRFQGRFDSPLTPRGRAQALAQRKILGSRDLSGFRAFSSPQGRAFQTAALALDGLMEDIRTDDRLSEIGLGDWAGLDRSTLMASQDVTNPFELYERAPKGEGFAALAARCRAFLTALDGPAVLVTHGMTSRMMRLVLLGRALGEIAHVEGGQGVVYHVANGAQTRLGDMA